MSNGSPVVFSLDDVGGHIVRATEDALRANFCSSIEDFDILSLVGKGGFGRVLQVAHKASKAVYALKVLDREGEHSDIDSVLLERQLVAKAVHPFVLPLHCAFQTNEHLCLLTDFAAGGELGALVRRCGALSEDAARVYVAELVLALTHLHDLGIVHRDLKPENVLLDSAGHVMLADFGLACDLTARGSGRTLDDPTTVVDSAADPAGSPKCPPEAAGDSPRAPPRARAFSVCGTDEFMAPEMLACSRRSRGGRKAAAAAAAAVQDEDSGRESDPCPVKPAAEATPPRGGGPVDAAAAAAPAAGYDTSVDWWALGCLTLELLTGMPAFSHRRTSILRRQIQQSRPRLPPHLSAAARSLVSDLLAKEPADRLGCGGAGGGPAAVRAHAFFRGVDWAALEARASPGPAIGRPPVPAATAPSAAAGPAAAASVSASGSRPLLTVEQAAAALRFFPKHLTSQAASLAAPPTGAAAAGGAGGGKAVAPPKKNKQKKHKHSSRHSALAATAAATAAAGEAAAGAAPLPKKARKGRAAKAAREAAAAAAATGLPAGAGPAEDKGKAAAAAAAAAASRIPGFDWTSPVWACLLRRL